MLKAKTDKIESHSEACIFVSYPKDTRGGLFYSPMDSKVFVSTTSTFLENDYINNYKPKNEVIIEEIIGEISTPRAPNIEAHVVDESTCC